MRHFTGKAAYLIPSYSTGSAGWGRVSPTLRRACVRVIAVDPTPSSARDGVGEPGLHGRSHETVVIHALPQWTPRN
jgi:hypothetical protein